MNFSKNGSFYIEESSKISLFNGKLNFVKIIMTLLSLTLLVGASITSFISPIKEEASAYSLNLFCSDSNSLGPYMESSAIKKTSLAEVNLPDSRARYWTLQELFGNNTYIINYEGENSGSTDASFFVREIPEDRVPSVGNIENVRDRLNNTRNMSTCIIGGASANFTTSVFMVSNVYSMFVSKIVTWSFDSSLICDNGPQANCIDLMGIIGGDPSNDYRNKGNATQGLIGALTQSLYFPLIAIMIAFTGIWVAYNGLVKRKFRESLFGVIWILSAAIAGIILLLNPSLLTRAPMAITNTLGTCIVGAVSGENCFSNSSFESNVEEGTSTNICYSSSDDSSLGIDERMQLTLNSLNCSIWKAFVLEPWSKAQFGYSFEELDVYTGEVSNAIESAGFGDSKDMFCVDLYSSSSWNAQDRSEYFITNSGYKQVCNLAAYQLSLQKRILTDGDTIPVNGELDERWYPLITVMASDDYMWDHWSYNISGSVDKIAVSSMSVLATLIGGSLLGFTGIMALIYIFSSILLMALAPVFFLLALHPGRGKKLFLGWVETLVSFLLKYLASAVFLVIALGVYSGLFAGMTNIGFTLILLIVMSVALFLYRKEIINLLGRANMGGEKIANKFGNVGQKAKSLAETSAGSAVGAFVASGGSVKAALSGAGDGARRDLKRGGGFVGNTFRQAERGSAANKQLLKSKASEANQEAARARETYEENRNVIEKSQNVIEKASQEMPTQTELDQASNNFDQAMKMHQSLTVGINNDDLRQLFELKGDRQVIESNKRIAIAAQDQDLYNSYDEKEKELNQRINEISSKFNSESLDRVTDEFNSRLNSSMQDTLGASASEIANTYVDTISRAFENKREYEIALDKYNEAGRNYADHTAAKAAAEHKAKTLKEENEKILATDFVGNDKVDHKISEGDKEYEKIYQQVKDNQKSFEVLESKINDIIINTNGKAIKINMTGQESPSSGERIATGLPTTKPEVSRTETKASVPDEDRRRIYEEFDPETDGGSYPR